MPENHEPENHRVDIEQGNYNERIEGNYVEGNFIKNIIFYILLGGQKLAPRASGWQNLILTLLLLALIGFELAITFRHLFAHQIIAAIQPLLITIILILLLLIKTFIVIFLNHLVIRWNLKQEQQAAIIADLIWHKLEFTIWEITSPFHREYYQHLIHKNRDYQTQGLDKDRILKLKKVFIPLKIAPKEVVQVNSRMIPQTQGNVNKLGEKQKPIWDFLAMMNENPAFRRMIVLGAPGSGKTTLLRYLAFTYANRDEQKLHPKVPKLIPVLLYLKDVHQEIINRQLPLAELITEEIRKQRKTQPLNPLDNWFLEKLRRNKCLIMLDGLDEVADENQRQQVSRWVDEQMHAYPDTAFILTSRPLGYQKDKIAVDMNYITCAEYQLFIDENMLLGQDYKPDHWTSDRFPHGEAKKPIVGVRANYAEEFCNWLTQRHSILGFRYRLPELTEVDEYPVTKGLVGYWCRDGEKKVITGIEPTQWQFWKEHLNGICEQDLVIINALIATLDSNDIFSYVLAKNISENIKKIDDSCFVQLYKALFNASPNDLIKYTNCLCLIDFSSALHLDNTISYSILDTVIQQTINDIFKQTDNHSSLSKVIIDSVEIKLREAEEKFVKAEKQFQDAKKEFSEAHEYLNYYKDYYEEIYGILEDYKNLIDTSTYNKLKSTVSSVKRKFQIAKTLFLQESNHLKANTLKRDQIADDVKSLDNKLKKNKTQHKDFMYNVNFFRNKIDQSTCYYLFLFAILFSWLSSKRISNSQSILESKLPLEKIEYLNSDYIVKRNEFLELYAFLVLIHERQAGRIEAWEGIRIVRERV